MWPLAKTNGQRMASFIETLCWQYRKVVNSKVLYDANFVKFGEAWVGWRKREMMRVMPCNLCMWHRYKHRKGTKLSEGLRVGCIEWEGAFRPTREDDQHGKYRSGTQRSELGM